MWISVNQHIEQILNEKWSIIRRALALFEMQVAYHTVNGPKLAPVDTEHHLVWASKRQFDKARVLVASKLMDHLDDKSLETRELFQDETFEGLMGAFRRAGGFKNLRISNPRAFDNRMDSWADRARNIGILADISLRLPAPEKGNRRKNRITFVLNLFQDDEDQENRKILGLTLGRTRLQKYYTRFKHVLPFAHATYMGTKRDGVMRPLHIHHIKFVPRLLKLVQKREEIIDFCARHNEAARRLNALGYNFELIAPPQNVIFPEVSLKLEPWPKDIPI